MTFSPHPPLLSLYLTLIFRLSPLLFLGSFLACATRFFRRLCSAGTLFFKSVSITRSIEHKSRAFQFVLSHRLKFDERTSFLCKFFKVRVMPLVGRSPIHDILIEPPLTVVMVSKRHPSVQSLSTIRPFRRCSPAPESGLLLCVSRRSSEGLKGQFAPLGRRCYWLR
jgi:hypothetical protein